VTVTTSVAVAVALDVRLGEGRLGVGETLCATARGDVALGVMVAVAVGVALGVEVSVCVAVGVRLGEGLGVSVEVAVALGVALGVDVAEGDGVWEGVMLGVCVAVAVVVGVRLGVCVIVALGVLGLGTGRTSIRTITGALFAPCALTATTCNECTPATVCGGNETAQRPSSSANVPPIHCLRSS